MDHSTKAHAVLVIQKTSPIFKEVMNTHLEKRALDDGSVTKKEGKNKTEEECRRARQRRYNPYLPYTKN